MTPAELSFWTPVAVVISGFVVGSILAIGLILSIRARRR